MIVPTTIQELKSLMIKNCYNLELYSIDGNIIYEGFGLEKWGELFIWYYIERGSRENIKYFQSEKEAVIYAFNEINKDKYSHSHLIINTDNIYIKEQILKELKKRSVKFWIEEIPLNFINYRIFANGCDINKVRDLIKY